MAAKLFYGASRFLNLCFRKVLDILLYVILICKIFSEFKLIIIRTEIHRGIRIRGNRFDQYWILNQDFIYLTRYASKINGGSSTL